MRRVRKRRIIWSTWHKKVLYIQQTFEQFVTEQASN
jgi:hypothetical protein